MALQIQLKAKEFYLAAFTLFNEPSSQTFNLLHRIQVATTGVLDEDVVSVSAEVSEIELVYRKLTNSPEGVFAQINDAMYLGLSAQIAAGIANNDAEWIELGTKLGAIRDENLSLANSYIAYAKQKLG